jgi:radical SAM protein with 4Fe4S-binding SPASM domain
VATLRGPFYRTPPKITISFTETCNLQCKHCYADCGRRPARDELTGTEWVRFIDYLVKHEFISVYFEGGEPLHRPDFLRVLQRSGPKLMTMVRTNGTLITAAVAKDLRRAGVALVLVDIMGAYAPTHDWFTGVRGSYRRSCDAIRLLQAEGVEAWMLTILNRRNAAEMNDYLALAASLRVPKVGILRLYPLGRAKRHWSELSMSLEEQMAVIQGWRVPAGVRVMQSWHPKDKNCCWQAAAVNAYGDSIGCSYLREYVNYGSIRDVPFLKTWDHPLYRTLRSGDVEATCSDCQASEGTRGGCRSTAYAYHRRWNAPDPFCSNLNDGVDLRVLPQHLV